MNTLSKIFNNPHNQSAWQFMFYTILGLEAYYFFMIKKYDLFIMWATFSVLANIFGRVLRKVELNENT